MKLLWKQTLTHLKRQVTGQEGMIAVIVGRGLFGLREQILSASLTVVAGSAFRLKLLVI